MTESGTYPFASPGGSQTYAFVSIGIHLPSYRQYQFRGVCWHNALHSAAPRKSPSLPAGASNLKRKIRKSYARCTSRLRRHIRRHCHDCVAGEKRAETDAMVSEASEATEEGSTPTGALLSSGRRRRVKEHSQIRRLFHGVFPVSMHSQSQLPIVGACRACVESPARFVFCAGWSFSVWRHADT